MASISSIDIDQNLSKFNVQYIAQSSFLQNIDKKTIVRALLFLLLAVTFILACRGVSSSNSNEQILLEMKEAVSSFSEARTDLEIMIQAREASNNKTFEKLEGNLKLLSLNRHCPNRWVLFSGLCYYFSKKYETATWEESKKLCKRMQKSSNLAMPKNLEQNNFLKQVNNITEGSAVHPDIWIGGSDIDEEGVWKWVDGTSIAKSLQDDNWALGEPNNAYSGTQHCLAKYFRGGRGTRNSQTDKFWDDAVCEAKKKFICSFDPQFDCPRVWNKFNYSCYFVSGIMAPWEKARSYCKKKQNASDLVHFHSAFAAFSLLEASFVQGLITDRSRYEEIIWVGASDIKREGDWKWVNGESVISSLWNAGEPNNQPNNIGKQLDCMISQNLQYFQGESIVQ